MTATTLARSHSAAAGGDGMERGLLDRDERPLEVLVRARWAGSPADRMIALTCTSRSEVGFARRASSSDRFSTRPQIVTSNSRRLVQASMCLPLVHCLRIKEGSIMTTEPISISRSLPRRPPGNTVTVVGSRGDRAVRKVRVKRTFIQIERPGMRRPSCQASIGAP